MLTEAKPSVAVPPRESWLRSRLEQLTAIYRPSASPGERQAAEWLVDQFAETGAEARIEDESAHGTFWWPIGVGAAAGALAGIAALRGRRLLGAGLAAAAAAAIADDFPPNRRRLRTALGKRPTTNVVAELGPTDAKRTVVIVAHHDAAHQGLLFHPEVPRYLSSRFPDLWAKAETSPPMMFPAIGAPLAVAAGSLLGSRRLTALGTAVCAATVAVMADIGVRRAVPAANDNGTGVVALLAVARALRERSTENVRVLLVSAGSEESFSEGIKAFGERHFASLPLEDTFFLSIDSLGSTHLNVLRGEGFLKMWEYPQPALDLIDGLAEELGIWLYPNLRLRNGTDGLEPLAAGYPTASLCSVTDYKVPANYHWPTDTAENVDYETLSDGIRLIEAVIRRLDDRWL